MEFGRWPSRALKKERKSSAVTFARVLVMNLLSELRKSHGAVVVALSDCCLIKQGKKRGTDVLCDGLCECFEHTEKQIYERAD